MKGVTVPLASAASAYITGQVIAVDGGVTVVLGGMRELAGQGTLLSGIDLVFGEEAKGFVLHMLPGYRGFLLAILPPGAFLALGLLIAANNWKKARAERRVHAAAPVPA